MAKIPIIIGIYRIVHIESGRHYIGSSHDVIRRWWKHQSDLRRDQHHSPYLQNVWNKYGESAFVFEIVQECAVEDLLKIEQEFIDLERPVFNSAPVAGSLLGSKWSEERLTSSMPRLLAQSELLGTPEQKSERRKAYFAAMTPEERRAYMAPAIAAQTIEGKRKASKIGTCVQWHINRGLPCICGTHQ